MLAGVVVFSDTVSLQRSHDLTLSTTGVERLEITCYPATAGQ